MATSTEDLTARFLSWGLMAPLPKDVLMCVWSCRPRRRFLRKACLKDLVLVPDTGALLKYEFSGIHVDVVSLKGALPKNITYSRCNMLVSPAAES
ncbi:hypothetical protein TRIUR3_30215 [Triticum urartu]|uniref:Uncharacterized protein n=1 Tax=Triticum urartu TaxID=4572 RepID=M7XM61_TRIUA|nr:hypothetical protein TRIUR3_30215 [Triticum urartu]